MQTYRICHFNDILSNRMHRKGNSILPDKQTELYIIKVLKQTRYTVTQIKQIEWAYMTRIMKNT